MALEKVSIHVQAIHHRTPSTEPSLCWPTAKPHLSGQDSQFQKLKDFSEGQCCGHIAQTKQENAEIREKVGGGGWWYVLGLCKACDTSSPNRICKQVRTTPFENKRSYLNTRPSVPLPSPPRSARACLASLLRRPNKCDCSQVPKHSYRPTQTSEFPRGSALKVMSSLGGFTISSPTINQNLGSQGNYHTVGAKETVW